MGDDVKNEKRNNSDRENEPQGLVLESEEDFLSEEDLNEDVQSDECPENFHDILISGRESLQLDQAIFSGFLKKKGERRRVSFIF